MAKDFIGFGLIRRYGDVRAIGITSEKRGQTYGRYLDNDHVAHWGRHDVFYRFPADTTPEFANAAADRAAKERAKHADGIEAARHRLRQLETARDEAVVDAAKGWGRLGTPPAAPACVNDLPPPPTEHHRIEDPRTWECGPSGKAYWVGNMRMRNMGFDVPLSGTAEDFTQS